MEIIGVKDVSGVRIVEFEFDDKSYTLMSWIVLPKEFWKTPMRHWAIAKGHDLKAPYHFGRAFPQIFPTMTS